jgi:hypothetical protein
MADARTDLAGRGEVTPVTDAAGSKE